MNETPFSILSLGAAILLVAVIPKAQAGESRFPDKVRTPVWPGISWLYNKALEKMVAPNLADTGGDPLLATDMAAESLMGASNYATALSNGRLFVEISPWAELAVFRWPNPTYSDQLSYLTFANGANLRAKAVRQGKDAPGPDWSRYGRPVEPYPGLGSSGGVMSGAGQTLWSHDPIWKSSRAFIPEDGTILRTELQGESVQMVVEDFIHPEMDLLTREFTIKGAADIFFYHATFAPLMAKPGEYTSPNPKSAGFAAVFLKDEDVILHFKPKDGQESRGGKNLGPNLTAKDLDQVFPSGGVFIAWGFDAASDEHQVGAAPNVTGIKNAPPGGVADSADGSLGMNDFFRGRVDAAMALKLAGGENKVTVYIAVADSAEKSVGLIKRARETGPAIKRETRDHWSGVSGRIHLPIGAGEVETRVAKRSILNLIQGQDKDGGSIVASVSRQPAYHFDWPRDGAFFDLTLDMAGFPELVGKHHEFYRRTQFTAKSGFAPARIVNFQAPVYKPAGHWPSNMAADGSYGSVPSVIHFELDETALLAWDMWRHEKTLNGQEAREYIARMKPVLEAAADALVDYVDFEQGWTRPAFEDDGFPPKATLHGVASVLTGLAAACDAGPRWEVEKGRQKKWCEAAAVLREGALQRIGRPEVMELAGWRGQSWSLWPAPIFDDYNEPAAAAIKQALAEKIKAKMTKSTPGFAYMGEEIFTLALADGKQGEYRELLRDALRFLTDEVPFPGTDCYGEVTLWVEVDGKKVAQQRTSIPHLWNGVTVYLAAMAIYQPEAFEGMKPPTPHRSIGTTR